MISQVRGPCSLSQCNTADHQETNQQKYKTEDDGKLHEQVRQLVGTAKILRKYIKNTY